MIMEELWKQVKDYEGYYEVSTFGRVKSLKRPRCPSERILKTRIDKEGYERCSLSKNGKTLLTTVHRIVAFAFLDYPKNDRTNYVPDHINGIKSDNTPENLRFVTHRFNCSVGFKKNKESFSSIYAGVSKNQKSGKWVSAIRIGGKTKYLGLFKNEIDAANAYQTELSKLSAEIKP